MKAKEHRVSLARRFMPAHACAWLLVISACGDDGGGASSGGTGGTLPAATGGNASTGTGGSPMLAGVGGASAGGMASAGGSGSGGVSSTGGVPGAGGKMPVACTDSPEGVEIVELGRAAANGAPAGVIAYRVAYDSADGTRVQGQMCIPDTPGPHPIIVHNHGGVEGLGIANWGPNPGNLCLGTASAGVVFVEPQYRGTVDRGQNAALGAIDIRSEGRVEFCAGEVDDSLALMRIAQRRCDANPDEVFMWGESHGACTTLVAASRHPEGLRAAATLVAPIDLAAGYEYNVARVPGGSIAPEAGCDAVADHQYISAGFEGIFGTPTASPEGYRSRSPIYLAADLAEVPLLMVFGVNDCLIQPHAEQGCAMRDALVAAGATVTATHFDASGQPTTVELPGCSPMGFEPAWPPPAAFAGDHYIVFGDRQGHSLQGPARKKETDAMTAFFLAHVTMP